MNVNAFCPPPADCTAPMSRWLVGDGRVTEPTEVGQVGPPTETSRAPPPVVALSAKLPVDAATNGSAVRVMGSAPVDRFPFVLPLVLLPQALWRFASGAP